MISANTFESQRAFILQLLAEAGAAGLPKSRMRINGTLSGQRYASALRALEEEDLVGNLGYTQKSCYVLRVHFNPLERAYDAILAQAGSGAVTHGGPIPLFRRESLLERLPVGAVKRHGEEALRLLVQEGALVAVKTGNSLFYFARSLLPDWRAAPDPASELPSSHDMAAQPPPPPPALQDESWAQVVEAYQRLRKKQGFRDLLIADVHHAMGKAFPLAQLKGLLLEACRQGQAVASLGDASLASKKERKAGIEIHGKLHLLIRLGDALVE